MNQEPFIHQIFTGKKQVINQTANQEQWETAIFKTATEDLIWLSIQGLAGDEPNANNKALYSYPIKHYRYWERLLDQPVIEFGTMGENLSVLEMDEFTVCIGDTYRFGEALIQVSQPHLPHWEVARRLERDDLAAIMQERGYTGWYFRVLEEGDVLSKIDLELLDRPYPEWTIARCNEIMHSAKIDYLAVDQLCSCEALSINWRKLLQALLRGQRLSSENRLFENK